MFLIDWPEEGYLYGPYTTAENALAAIRRDRRFGDQMKICPIFNQKKLIKSNKYPSRHGNIVLAHNITEQNTIYFGLFYDYYDAETWGEHWIKRNKLDTIPQLWKYGDDYLEPMVLDSLEDHIDADDDYHQDDDNF